jgi:hypothetical protein
VKQLAIAMFAVLVFIAAMVFVGTRPGHSVRIPTSDWQCTRTQFILDPSYMVVIRNDLVPLHSRCTQ